MSNQEGYRGSSTLKKTSEKYNTATRRRPIRQRFIADEI